MSDDRFSNQQSAPKGKQNKHTVPAAPKHCLDPDCTRKADVAWMVVGTPHGIQYGDISQFGHLKQGAYVLNDGIEFKRWETRCSECYDRRVRQIGRCANQFDPYQNATA